jgi:hypothetical protein
MTDYPTGLLEEMDRVLEAEQKAQRREMAKARRRH